MSDNFFIENNFLRTGYIFITYCKFSLVFLGIVLKTNCTSTQILKEKHYKQKLFQEPFDNIEYRLRMFKVPKQTFILNT